MTPFRAGKGFWSFAAFVLATILGSSGAGAEDAYHLVAGDVVAVSVAGFPDLSREAEVQLDGSISLPLVGEVAAAGRTLTDVREAIRASIASKVVPVYTSDGEKHLRIVSRDDVSAWIAEYRPLFVSGEVARPGEFRFRPGITVRQAIAAAGGVVPEPVGITATSTAGLEADYKGAWHALAADEARIWRLRTELGEDIAFDPQVLPASPEWTASLDEMLKLETDLRAARDLDHERERAFLARVLDQISRQTDVLTRQLEAERASEALDAADLAKANEAIEKGILTQARMADLRSAALLSTTRRLQTEANLMQLERRATEVARDLERLDDRRHRPGEEELVGGRDPDRLRARRSRGKDRRGGAQRASAVGRSDSPCGDVLHPPRGTAPRLEGPDPRLDALAVPDVLGHRDPLQDPARGDR